MSRNWFFIILLYPFSLIFAGIISIRNLLYELGLIKSTSFNLPVINVGNLSVGGTGKTPHIEYLVRLLNPFINVATISRGYKRKTKGFRLINTTDDAKIAGDEPMQFKTKFPDMPVAVSESRNIGIPLLLKQHPEVQTVLMDDAFQHRSVVPGMNILLTEYSRMFTDDFLLPAGRLREPKTSYHRADIIIVTKCPHDLTQKQAQNHINDIKPYHYQKVFFSKYKYLSPYYLFDRDIKVDLATDHKVHLISAIANVDYLVQYLETTSDVVNIIKYEDHHYFTDFELQQLKRIIEHNSESNNIFITTEKDAMRLQLHQDFLLRHNIPIFVLPVEVLFFGDQNLFDNEIKSFLLDFKV